MTTAQQERLSGVVQAVGRRPADIDRRWWESTAVFVAFTVLYSVVGYWLVVQVHVVGFETLDRFARSLMVVHDESPRLAAIGFDYPPLAVLFLTPFTLVPGLARSLVVVPVVSAVFAALTMVAVNTMMRRALVTLPLRLAVLATLGLNPLVVLYAGVGARHFLWLALVVAALGALLAWYVTADIRFVMVAGLAYAVATLAGYGSLVWFLVSLVMVGAILVRLGADGREVEGTTVGFATPTLYVVALWTAFNLLLLSDPFHWITESSDLAASGGLADFSFGDVVSGTVELVVRGAPVAVVVLPALVFSGIARRNGFALWLGVLLAVSILSPGVAVALRLTDSPLVMSNALPILLVSVVGAIWLARSAMTSRALVAGALAVGLLLSIPWTFAAMKDFRQQGLERAFHDAVSTGEDQEGATTLDGSTVGYGAEQDMADFIRANVADPGAILTDNAATYAVMLLTGSPATFLDRVDTSEEAWTRAARDPAAHVDYLLLSADTATDQLSARYPAAATGTDPTLPTVHANRRYTLVEVPSGFGFGTVDQDPSTATGDTSGPDPAEVGGYDGVVGEGSTDTGTTP
jgi:hypothetical protein